MACPTCDHTMHLVADSEFMGKAWMRVWHCPRCGTIKTSRKCGPSQSNSEIVPELADQFWNQPQIKPGSVLDIVRKHGIDLDRVSGDCDLGTIEDYETA